MKKSQNSNSPQNPIDRIETSDPAAPSPNIFTINPDDDDFLAAFRVGSVPSAKEKVMESSPAQMNAKQSPASKASAENVKPKAPDANFAVKENSKNSTRPASHGVAKLHVCLLDDSHASSQTILHLLRDEGHQIDHFFALDDALDALNEIEYDVLLASQTMPYGDTDCEGLLRAIRSSHQPEQRRLPIIVMVANPDPANIKALRQAGADEIIVKPIKPDLGEKLIKTVESCQTIPMLNPVAQIMKVCLLEDSYALSKLISEILIDDGHEVDHFSLPEEALDAVFEKDYDLLIASQNDGQLGLDCAGLIQQIRTASHPTKRHIPIVVLAAEPAAANLKTLTAAGASRIIYKGADNLHEQLLEALNLENGDQLKGPHSWALGASKASTQSSNQVRNTNHPPKREAKPAPRAENRILPSSPPMVKDDVTKQYNKKRVANRELPQSAEETKFFGHGANPPRKTFRNIGITLGLMALLAMGGGGVWFYLNSAVPVEVVAVHQGTLSKSINGIGRVVSRKQVDLTATMAGQLMKVSVEEGQPVKKGDVLATLDDREAVIGIKRAEAQLASAKEEVSYTQRSLDEMQLSRDSNSNFQDNSLQTALRAAKNKQTLAAAELRASRLALERLNVIAPFSGVVTQSFAVEGLWVQPPAPIFTLADMTQKEVAIRVDPVDGRDINTGQEVTLSSSAFPALEWKEQIIRLAPAATNGTQQDLTVYTSLGRNAPPVDYGAIVEAKIVTESNTNAIKLPFEAISKKDGDTVVALVENGKVRYQPVTLGLQALTEVEVTKGLSIGQQVILPRKELKEGMRVAATVVPSFAGEDEGYPFRQTFADVPIYSTDQLRKHYEEVFIVDVRSRFEFDVVHVAKAVNIPISSENFAKSLESLRPKNGTVPIIFYCNGHTCVKSYEAVREAAAQGFKYVYAYDSGIMDWMKASRDRTSLLGATPAPIEKMVSEEYFQSRLLDFAAFKQKAKDDDALVIDIRDAMQKNTTMTVNTVEIPLDQFLAKLNNGDYKDKQLLIFDAVGKQIRWLQYILQDRGYKDYFFLREGINGINA